MYKAIVLGTSFGGLEALSEVLPKLKKGFPIPVIIVLHIGEHSNDTFIRLLSERCELPVKEAEGREAIQGGTIYFAPPNYHLLIEDDQTFILSTEKKQNYSRPSIDVLFESAAWVYKSQLIGVILTGANSDGARGLETIKKFGGVTIIENPCHAISPSMPRFALQIAKPHFRLSLAEIADKLIELSALPGEK